MQVLRPYQARALEQLRAEIRAGRRRIVLVAPTGSGKTTIASHMIASAVERGHHVAFWAHRTELLAQCSARLAEHGVEHTIQQASRRVDDDAPVRVVSVPTLHRRGDREHWPARLIVVDECHRSTAATYRECLDRYPDAIVIGLTATPYRADGTPLGDLYDSLVVVAQPDELVELGYLVEPQIYAASAPDLRGVKKRAGEYVASDLHGRVVVIVGSIVAELLKHKPSRTVAFAVTIAHSREIVARFSAAGVRAEHLDGSTPAAERAEILGRLRSGETQLVSNVGVLTEGWDLPELECVILARPTQSTGLYLQMVGRALRPGSRALILDHGGCYRAHGWPTLPRQFSLTEGERRGESDRSVSNIRQCEACAFVWPGRDPVCPACGHRKIYVVVDEVPAEVTEVKRPSAPLAAQGAERDRSLWDQLERQREERGYKRGWTYAKYRALTGRPPPWSWGTR